MPLLVVLMALVLLVAAVQFIWHYIWLVGAIFCAVFVLATVIVYLTRRRRWFTLAYCRSTVFLGIVACSVCASLQGVAWQNEASDQRREAELKKQEAEQHAQKEQQEAQEGAARMGVTLAQFNLGQSKEGRAHTECHTAALKAATWNRASRNWFPDYSWSINQSIIRIYGSDIKMKNGFGGEKQMSYNCLYHTDTGDVEILGVN